VVRSGVIQAICGALALHGSTAMAADWAKPRIAWDGLYAGGHFGYGSGTFGPSTHPLLRSADEFPSSITGFTGGLQLGYNRALGPNLVAGLEADVTFPGPLDPHQDGIAPYRTSYNYLATIRPRLGYRVGSFLPFVTGGLALGSTRIDTFDGAGNRTGEDDKTHVGWTLGAGIEWPIAGNWTGKAEYDYVALGAKTRHVPAPLEVRPDAHLFKLGVNYRFDAPRRTTAPTLEDNGWSIHGQTTFIAQGYGPIHSPYQGVASLPGTGMTRETWTATAFIGRKLWEGGAVYFNPEIAQGVGLAGTLGLAGFSNGEAQKAGGDYPRVRAQRYFFQQTFGFGGGQETVEDGPNQVAGKRDIDRVTLTVGRFAIGDYFDANAYAHDPRADFMNWAIWSSAAYDFPADLPGFTRGGVLEVNRKDWALRAGLFQVPRAPASDILEFKSGGGVVEYEQRYALWNQPGKLRVGAFSNRGPSGSYRNALNAVTAVPGTDINDAIIADRQVREKNGFYANVEQALGEDLGIFGRYSWNDGNNETLSFTDIDRSLSGGLSLKGARWKRPDDTFGLAGAINALSGPHRDFLAAGGTGLLIGDGRLNYRTEKILETYYLIGLRPGTSLTFDYQFIANPAYNADRGPVSVFSARLHAEF